MGAFTKWGRIAAAASSMAVLSVNTVFLESPKPVEQSKQQAEAQSKQQAEAQSKQQAEAQSKQQAEAHSKRAADVAAEKKKVQEEEATRLRRSKAPKMAPQFDGLNFYETFIGSAQR